MKSSTVEAFVKAHAEFMTVNDMAEELDISPSSISSACKKMGVKAILKGQQQRNYIKDVFLKKAIPEIAIKLGCDEQHVKDLIDELGLIIPKENPFIKFLSAPAILSRYKKVDDPQRFLTDPRQGVYED
jgi:hypothetical protein